MLKLGLAAFLQHIQSQNTWSQAMLQAHAGKSIAIDAKLVRAHWVILENGRFTIAGETAAPDATLTITPSTLLRLAANDTEAQSQVKLSGDTALAASLAKVLTHLRWDITDDLSHVVGDVASEQLASSSQQVLNTAKETVNNIGEMMTEYLTEEAMLIAKPTQLNQFNDRVDTLKADTARLEIKLQQLTLRLNHEGTTS